jgi:hypothetical protein
MKTAKQDRVVVRGKIAGWEARSRQSIPRQPIGRRGFAAVRVARGDGAAREAVVAKNEGVCGWWGWVVARVGPAASCAG